MPQAPSAANTWGYLRSDLQALPLEYGRSYRIGRKLDCDLALKVRRRRRSSVPPASVLTPRARVPAVA